MEYPYKRCGGFTLIELMVVISICAIIIAIIFGGFSSAKSGQINPYVFPKQAQASALQQQADATNRMAAALEEQNRLAREKANK